MAHIISYKQLPRLRLSNAARESLAYGLSLLFVILFLYTVYHKAVGIDAFTAGIAKIPLVGAYSVEVAWGVLGAEALVAVLMIWPDTNRLALWGALVLMIAFTLYISAMMLFANQLPCHCGGAIEKLTWGQHLLFNCGFIALAVGLLLYHYKVNVKQKILTAMKAINSKIKKAVFGVMMAALTIGFSAFTYKSKQTLEEWHFKSGEPIENAREEGSYEMVSGNPTGCDEAEVLPCIIEFDTEDPATPDLESYLSQFLTDQEVVDEAKNTRSN